MIAHLRSGLIKKTQCNYIDCRKTSQYFPKPYEAFSGDINVKIDLSNYATKTDIKNIYHVDTSSFALKSNLASLKTEADKLDIDKLKSLPNNLSNLKSKVDKLDINKLASVLVDLSELTNEVKLKLFLIQK